MMQLYYQLLNKNAQVFFIMPEQKILNNFMTSVGSFYRES